MTAIAQFCGAQLLLNSSSLAPTIKSPSEGPANRVPASARLPKNNRGIALSLQLCNIENVKHRIHEKGGLLARMMLQWDERFHFIHHEG